MPKITINFSEPFLLGSPAHRSEVTSYLDYPSPELYNDVRVPNSTMTSSHTFLIMIIRVKC